MDQAQSVGTLTIRPSPVEGIAGGTLTVSVEVITDPVRDLRDHTVLIQNEEGETLSEAKLAYFDGDVSATGDVTIEAPPKAGELTWKVAFEGVELDDVRFGASTSTMPVTLKPQAMRMMAWDIPPTTVVNAPIQIKVGVKSSTGLNLAGVELAIFDEDGKQLASGTAGPTPWQNTEALFFAELEMAAPDRGGQYKWEARVAASDEDVSRAAGTTTFGIHVVNEPEHTVTIEAIDHETQTPVAGARVVMHPYRGTTDEKGIARIQASKGDYTLFVSKKKYDPMSREVELTGDIDTKVELIHEEPEPDPGDYYL